MLFTCRLHTPCYHLRGVFVKRGYNRKSVVKTANEVRDMDRTELLTYRKIDSKERVPIVITYHHKFTGISNVLKDCYNRMLQKYPEMKKVVPAPPLVAYRRTRNLRDKLVRANHQPAPPAAVKPTHQHTRTFIDSLMNNSGTISNTR